MPEIVRALAAPLANVDKITIVSTGDGDAAGMNKITGDMTQMAAQIPALFETLSGMQMSELFGKVKQIGDKVRPDEAPANGSGSQKYMADQTKGRSIMALLERVSTLMRANLNDLIDKAEDPEKMIKQVILDMENQLMQVKTQVAIAIADQHLLARRSNGKRREQSPSGCARRSWRSSKRQDDLARGALERAMSYRQLADGFEEQVADQKAQVESLKNALRKLEQKLAEARSRRAIC